MSGPREIVATVDRLGYLACAEHEIAGEPVRRDSSPHAFESCDICGKIVNES